MTSYILGESQGETERLRTQAAHDSIEERLRWAGVTPGMVAVDAGCGPGDVSRELGRLIGPTGAVHGFDLSPARLDAARAHPVAHGSAPLQFELGDVRALPFPAGQADFVVCQYVLEYLAQPAPAVESLARLLKPGGKMLLVDGDGIGTIQWPAPAIVEEKLPLMVQILAKTGFDPYVGRKLFSFAAQAGLRDLQVMIYPQLLAGGAVRLDQLQAWEQRLTALAPLGAQAFGSAEAWNLFTSAYLAMLADRSSFKLILGVAVHGTR